MNKEMSKNFHKNFVDLKAYMDAGKYARATHLAQMWEKEIGSKIA